MEKFMNFEWRKETIETKIGIWKFFLALETIQFWATPKCPAFAYFTSPINFNSMEITSFSLVHADAVYVTFT